MPQPAAFVRFQKLEATPKEVCEDLLRLDPTNARVGDIRDLQRLAKVALDGQDNAEHVDSD